MTSFLSTVQRRAEDQVGDFLRLVQKVRLVIMPVTPFSP
jgi:hypothetical protein